MSKPATCRFCKTELKPHERAEGECDACLRKLSTRIPVWRERREKAQA